MERLAGQLAEAKFQRLKHDWRVEWEDWQRREEHKWSERLRQKEATRVAELEEAFAARERDRAATVGRSQAEYVRLEAKLRKALGDVEVGR